MFDWVLNFIEMNKLELKHLAPYLPYGLKFKRKSYDYIHTILGISFEDVIFELGKTPIKYVTPILRPLSDLTKEIEFNGEKYVPIEKLSSDLKMNVIEYCHLEQNPQLIHETARYVVIEKLFEWHFDVYDLIGKNIAIDKNTI